MPHIHTQPDQHDMTVSAWIVLHENDEWKCLVHYHKKMDALMQIGGHIELNETPWQAMAHELEEESGFLLDELEVLQHADDRIEGTFNIQHPTPFSMNTHNVGDEHFHSDLCYGFVAKDYPRNTVHDGESADLRWLSLTELRQAAQRGEAMKDVAAIYQFLLDHFDSYVRVSARNYSIEKPQAGEATYKRGGAAEARA